MLQARKIRIVEERSARRAPLTDVEVKRLLKAVTSVTIARGRKAATQPASEVRPADLRGPSGNYRAPMILRGKKLLVGFNKEAVDDFV